MAPFAISGDELHLNLLGVGRNLLNGAFFSETCVPDSFTSAVFTPKSPFYAGPRAALSASRMEVTVPSVLGRVRKFTSSGKLRGKDILVVRCMESLPRKASLAVSSLRAPLYVYRPLSQRVVSQVLSTLRNARLSLRLAI